jgi:Uma2 family endonuclease
LQSNQSCRLLKIKQYSLTFLRYLSYVKFMAMPAFRQDYKYTFSDYISWPDEEHWEIIEGTPIAMSPAPNPIHQRILWNLSGILHKAKDTGILKGCAVYLAPFDVRLPEKNESDESITTVVQPDLSIICNKSKIDDRGCRGAPDLIIEILSPGSAKHDLETKRDLYEKHAVPEYWIVFPNEKLIHIFRLNDSGRYQSGSVFTQADSISSEVIPGLSVNVSDVFAEE